MKHHIIRSFIIASLMTALAVTTAFAQQKPSDVPTNHWAYEAVVDLVNRGYLTVEDGRFHGEETVDRFTLATVIARILYEIETGGVTPQSQDDVDLLRRVVNEFHSELVTLYARIDGVESHTLDLEKEIDVHRDNFSKIYLALDDMLDQLDDFESDMLMAEASQQAALRAETVELRNAINERFAQIEADLLEAGTQSEVIYVLDERLQDESVRLDDLEQLLKDLGANLARVTGHEEAIIELRREVNALSEMIAAHRIALSEQGDALAFADGQLLKGIEDAHARTDMIERKIEEIYLSETELAQLRDRLMKEIESQYQHSFLLSGTLSKELKELQDEFQTYKKKSEQDIAAAKQGQMYGIIGAAVAVLALLMN